MESFRVQDSIPGAGDSNTPSTSVKSGTSPDESAKTKIETLDPYLESSSQPFTWGIEEKEINLRPRTDKGKTKVGTNEVTISPFQVYQQNWEKLKTRVCINPATNRVDVSEKYPRVWMKSNLYPKEVKAWYEFGALASVYTTSPSFPEILGLPKWIQEAVHETWANNDYLSRGDVLELYFFSAAPEPAGKVSHKAFNFIKLRSSDTNIQKFIKDHLTEVTPLVASITEDDISTRRACGLWVCLTEMNKVKFSFKFYQNSLNGSFMLNTMTRKITSFAEEIFEKKRNLLWNSKLPASKETRRKFCNMAHIGRLSENICPECQNQKEPESGKGFKPRSDRKHFTETGTSGEGPQAHFPRG